MPTHRKAQPSGPLTYVISYTEGNTVDDRWAEQIAAAPPDILHHGHDVPFNSIWGPAAGLSAWNPDPGGIPADVFSKIDALRRGVDRLHTSGVKWVIPYVNPSIIGGGEEPPTGFFDFWKRKAAFAEFGFADLADDDPLDWMQRNRFSFEPYSPDSPYSRYEPCLRREAWVRYIEIVCRLTAKAGYDGLFTDDLLVSCYCPQCVRDFRRFLAAEYADRLAEITVDVPLNEVFPYSDDGKGLGPAYRRATTGSLSQGPPMAGGQAHDPWASIVWEASQAFWSQTIADALVRFRDAGQSENPDFFLVANWGMTIQTDALGIRRRLGHNFQRWIPAARWLLLEEGASCGYIAPGLVADFWTACRVVVTHGGEPALLAYTRQDAAQIDLVAAEMASVGAGAWVDGTLRADLRAAYRAFYTDRRELFDSCELYAPVGVFYSFDEITRNNDEHLALFYAVCRALGRSHIPYDVVTPSSVRDQTPEILVVPGSVSAPRVLHDRCAIVPVGPGGLSARSVIDSHEIELDAVLGLSAAAQQSELAGWASLDLRAVAPLAHILNHLTGRKLNLTDALQANAVRLRAFVQRKTRRLIVHVVNYGCTSMSPATPAPGPSEQFPMRVPDIEGWEPEAAWTEGPQVPRERLPISRENGTAITVPPTDVYRVIVVQFR